MDMRRALVLLAFLALPAYAQQAQPPSPAEAA